MQIPVLLRQKFALDHGYSGSLEQTIAQFEPWFVANQVVFFEEYTDHSAAHVEGVLSTAASLVRDVAWPYVTAADAYVLILSTLLHDAAMHLSRDGFVTLVTTARAGQIVPGFGDVPWDRLWEEFLSEARQFSAKQLRNLFGESAPTRKPPLTSPERMNARDLKLIGEFLRRHHHRLAHEFALFGIPGPGDVSLSVQHTAAERDLVCLAGLVARSHGMPLRAALNPLASEYDPREFQHAHPVFLMVLLRIADYLQVQRERAPEQRLLVTQLRSPVSREEWSVHHAVRSVRPDDDPEAIYVDGRPADVRTYLRMKGLLSGIQQELDASWAVLGEVYGRYTGEGWAHFGLTLRRVNSNLDDDAKAGSTWSYYPLRAAFEFDPDLLRLFIGPLYGDRPEAGIRELVQNAVDAVRERERMVELYQELGSAQFLEQEADVIVRLGRDPAGGWSLIVSDRGTGMTELTVRDYFLRAGASYRTSETWLRNFTDWKGNATVLRSGRFGVGTLAVFLLGDRISVTTRHLTRAPDQGVSFSASLDTDAITLQRVQAPVGTTVRVDISHETAEKLLKDANSWDWYCLDHPHVKRIVDMESRRDELTQRYSLPAPEAALRGGWHRAEHADFVDLQWTYKSAPALACNGVIVSDRDSVEWGGPWWGLPLSFPKVSVFDPLGKLPLKVDRSGVHRGSGSFGEAVRSSVVQNLVSYLLARTPPSANGDADEGLRRYLRQLPEPRDIYPSFDLGRHKQYLFHMAGGTSVISPLPICSAGIRRAIVVIKYLYKEPQLSQAPGCPVFEHSVFRVEVNPDTFDDSEPPIRTVLRLIRAALFLETEEIYDPVFLQKCTGIRALSNDRWTHYWANSLSGLINLAMVKRIDGREMIEIGACPEIEPALEALLYDIDPSPDEERLPAILELHFDPGAETEDHPLGRYWMEALGSPVIFHDPSQRREQIRSRWDVLAAHLRAYGVDDPDTYVFPESWEPAA
jgi:hypothetical protein